MPEFEPTRAMTPDDKQCLVGVLNMALNSDEDTAVEILNEMLRKETVGTTAAKLTLEAAGLTNSENAPSENAPKEKVARLSCGRCDTTINLHLEAGRIEISPPGCKLGDTIS